MYVGIGTCDVGVGMVTMAEVSLVGRWYIGREGKSVDLDGQRWGVARGVYVAWAGCLKVVARSGGMYRLVLVAYFGGGNRWWCDDGGVG